MKNLITRTAALAVLLLGAFAGTTQAEEGWYAGVDLLFLSPKLNAVGFNNIFYFESPVNQTAEGQTSAPLDFSQRVIIGYEGDQGGGMQVRWFSMDQTAYYSGVGEDSVNGSIAIAGNMNFDLDSIDVDFTQRGNFDAWDWLATAGVRYARLDIHEDASDEFEWGGFADAAWFGLAGQTFEGAGPTFSVEGSRNMFWEGFSLYGRARTALLFGEIEIDSIYRTGGGPLVISDVFAQVWEFQFGFRAEHKFDACDLVYGLFWEAQRWENDSNLGEFALHGFGVHTGIEY